MDYVPDLGFILAAMAAKGHTVFEDPRGYDLNIVGIRTDDDAADTFNDWITVFYKQGDRWVYFGFPATTDPGVYYRLHPMNVRGTAVLKPGQYRGAYKIGEHRGRPALQQVGRMTVYRDADRDETIDTDGKEESGLHAINLHPASPTRASEAVGKWSAGCQVMQDRVHFEFFLELCELGRRIYGNSFTYTLLDERDFYNELYAMG